MLRTRTGRDYAASVAEVNGLAFLAVQRPALETASSTELSVIKRSLERDYRLLSYLLKQASGVNVGGLTIEQRMLMFDFWLMRQFFTLTRRFSASQARAAVTEMADVLNHLANAMGEQVQASSRV